MAFDGEYRIDRSQTKDRKKDMRNGGALKINIDNPT